MDATIYHCRYTNTYVYSVFQKKSFSVLYVAVGLIRYAGSGQVDYSC